MFLLAGALEASMSMTFKSRDCPIGYSFSLGYQRVFCLQEIWRNHRERYLGQGTRCSEKSSTALGEFCFCLQGHYQLWVVWFDEQWYQRRSPDLDIHKPREYRPPIEGNTNMGCERTWEQNKTTLPTYLLSRTYLRVDKTQLFACTHAGGCG